MCKYLFVALLLLSFSQVSMAQAQNDAPNHKQRCLLLSVGLAVNKDYTAIKSSVAFNNLFYQRYGLYTSVEVSTSNGYFSNIYGVTGTFHKYLYAFGGVDLFTKHGLLTKGGIRKEIGIGFIPFNFGVFKVGWSFDVGITLEAGIRIAL